MLGGSVGHPVCGAWDNAVSKSKFSSGGNDPEDAKLRP